MNVNSLLQAVTSGDLVEKERPRLVVTGIFYVPVDKDAILLMPSEYAKEVIRAIDKKEEGMLAELARFRFPDFGALLTLAYKDDLSRFVRNRYGKTDEAEDIAENAIYVLLSKAGGNSAWSGNAATLWTWLSTVALNSIRSGPYKTSKELLMDDITFMGDGEDFDADEFGDFTPAFVNEHHNEYERAEQNMIIRGIKERLMKTYGPNGSVPNNTIIKIFALLPEMEIDEIARVLRISRQEVTEYIHKIKQIAQATT